ncbi:MAG: NfeD family protein [Rhodothermales bacterium]
MPASFRALCAFFLLLGLAAPLAAQATRTPAERLAAVEDFLGAGPVFVVPIEGMIDAALANYVERALADAAEAEASLVLFDIDTFGGLVDAADQIRSAILHAEIPTVAFIDPNAASAGALISYANDLIVMTPGASIGAATVVDGAGTKASEKMQSYMRGLMRATAEANGRDPRLAEAMVDENLAVDGVVEAGTLLTLSASEAERLGVADAVYETKDETLAALGAADRERVEHRATRAEQVLRFLGSPVVASILMMMMLGGLYFELQTPGIGFAGMASVLGAALFFAPHYMLGLVASWEIVLFVLGVLLLLAEVFVIPGFGVAGITGLVLTFFSLGAALIGNVGLSFPTDGAITQAILTLAGTLVLLVVLSYSLARYMPRSERFNHLILAPELGSASGYTSSDTDETLLGLVGVALTTLRPAGTAEIDGRRVDVVSQSTFVSQGEAVEVVSVRGSRVEVRPVPAS